MTNVVNLRMARKRKARAQKEQAAGENRALHGRSKAEKPRDRMEAEKAATLCRRPSARRSDSP